MKIDLLVDISLILFPAYNAFLNKIQTVSVVYVPTLGTQSGKESSSVSRKVQVPPSFTSIHPSSISFPPLPVGSYTSTHSPPPFMSPQPPPAQNRLQHWLWSIRHQPLLGQVFNYRGLESSSPRPGA